MFNLKPVALDQGDQAKMRALNDATAGVQRMVQMFVESGERRMAQLQEQGRETWSELAKKYGLDLRHVSYGPSEDGTQLIPLQVLLVEKPNGTN